VTWTIKNQGSRATRIDNSRYNLDIWHERVYLSKDPSLDFQDLFLAEFTNLGGTLEANGDYQRTENISLPHGIEGDFYLLTFVDANLIDKDSRFVYSGNLPPDASIYYEKKGSRRRPIPLIDGRELEFQGEGNNVNATPITVQLQPSPDLQVSAIEIPERAIVGQQFTLNYTVTNQGLGDTSNTETTWQDQIYLSRDQFLDPNSDYFVSYVDREGGLTAGDSYSVETTITPPSWLTGPFYVFVLTDPPNYDLDRDIFIGDVFEGKLETNNASPSTNPILLELPPPQIYK